ncbi:MAG: TIR domain-containing protein [Methylococcaceae bacterium]|nr:TIR domain-containing protein [Methylococcaceae bacterium]
MDNKGAETGTDYSYDGFLSYTTRGDYRIARRIESFLESFHENLDEEHSSYRALHICRDGSDLRRHRKTQRSEEDTIWNLIESRLRQSANLIVLCSPESQGAKWVQQELEWYLENIGESSVYLVVTDGDPQIHPDTVFPAPILIREIHKRHIWYDLREWRGSKSDKIRDAEDEVVRLALDILNVDHPAQAAVAAVWRREASRRARRTAKLMMLGATVTTCAALIAAWQFWSARHNAKVATASAIMRIAAATIKDPLRAGLILRQIDPQVAPSEMLGLGIDILGNHIPEARLRSHTKAISDAIFTDDGNLISAGNDGQILMWPQDGTGNPKVLRESTQDPIIALQWSSKKEKLIAASQSGKVIFITNVSEFIFPRIVG